MVGALFHSQINDLLGIENTMSPETAKANWQTNANFMKNSVAELRGAGVDELSAGTGYNFTLFSESAKQAAEALEHLKNVAGYSQEQVDALVASLDPLSQEFVASGQAANSLENEVTGLVESMNLSINSFAMSDTAARNYDKRIDELAQRLGLTGEEARAFREEIWGLAESFQSGGQEAAQFDQALDSFVSKTLGGLTKGAQDGTQAIKGLIGSMKQVKGAGGTMKITTSDGGGAAFSQGSGGMEMLTMHQGAG